MPRPIARIVSVCTVVLLTGACASAATVAGNPSPPPSPTAIYGAGAGPSASPATIVPVNLLGKDIEAFPTARKVVALTFDAGANADGLTSILATLSARRVPATFFLTGQWAARYPSSVAPLSARGYRLGNHTDTHPHLTTLTDAAITSQLTTARSKILAGGGTDPRPLFRFPYGDRNAHTISMVNRA